MNIKCSVCFDLLDEFNPPAATSCGHLYCLDCATFIFSTPGATCAICRKPHTMRNLVRLYPDYDSDKNLGQSPLHKRKSAPRLGNKAVTTEDARVRESERFTGDRSSRDSLLASPNVAFEIRKLLKSTRHALKQVDSKLDNAERLHALEEEVEQYQRKCRDLKGQIKGSTRERELERKDAAKALATERSEGKARLSEVKERLRAVKKEMSSAREEIKKAEADAKELDEEMKLWRTSANRYKKKFYALKARVRTCRRCDDSGDSLEVV